LAAARVTAIPPAWFRVRAAAVFAAALAALLAAAACGKPGPPLPAPATPQEESP